MVDMAAIAVVSTSLKAAADITKAMVGLRDASMIQGKIIELQGVILSAQQGALTTQSDQFSLLERVRELEKQVADLEAWDSEKQRYELKEVGTGSLAYVVKENARGTEPVHQICAACYQHRRKSILQPKSISMTKLLFCPSCKTDIQIGFHSFSAISVSRA